MKTYHLSVRALGLALAAAALLSGCSTEGGFANPWAKQPIAATPAPSSPVKSRGGRLTAEGFDMTSQRERRAAAVAAGGVRVGRTVASLGAPQEQGFWLRTGLVISETPGRVVFAGTGASVKVTLRPSGGDPGAGSQLSLAAFRLLGLPLTTLPPLEVYALR